MNILYIPIKTVAGLVAAGITLIGGSVILPQQVDAPLSIPSEFGTIQLIGGSTYNLAGAGVSGSATSITLASFTIKQTGQKILDTDLSDLFYITLEPGNNSRQEVVSCTTAVQNGNGSATLSGCSRGLSPITPYTASSTLAFSHGGGTQVVFSDPPQVFNQYAAKQNTESITGAWTFDDDDTYRPRLDADTDTVLATAFVTLGQLARTAASGASNASQTVKGIVELALGSEAGSSTLTGSTGANLALSTLISTSSAYTTGSWSVMTMPNAKIKQTFLDLTEAYVWPGLHTFSGGYVATASSTHSATTSIVANSVTARAFILNAIAYAFPATQIANADLSTNGAGVLTWRPKQYTFATSSVSVGNGTITSALLPIPAGVMTASSTIEVELSGNCTPSASSNGCAYDLVNSAGTSMGSVSAAPCPNSSCSNAGGINGRIFSVNFNSTSAQRVVSSAVYGITTVGAGAASVSGSSYGSSAVNTALADSYGIKVTAGSGVTATLNGFIIRVIP